MIKNYELVPKIRLATKWKWGIFASLFMMISPILLMGQSSAPNCVNLNLSINANDTASFTVAELVSNASVAEPLSLRIEGDFGQTIYSGTNLDQFDLISLHACNYRNSTLKVTVVNSIGQCWGEISFKFSSGYIMQSNLDTAVWCIDELINLDPNDFHEIKWYSTDFPYTLLPTAYVPCGEDKILRTIYDVDRDGDIDRYDARAWYAPRFEECEYRAIDWTEAYNCDGSDSAKVIIREWEAFNKEGVRSSIWDTIRVIKLPDLSEGSYIHAPQKDTVTCVLDSKFTRSTKDSYLCWKQLVGLHSDGTYIYYPESYVDDIIATVTEKVGIARLSQITVIHDNSANQNYNIYHIAGLPIVSGPYGEPSYVFKVGNGDRFLSNAGGYIEANSNWFYQANEHGFWVDLCIPSVDVCTWEEVCDVWPAWDCEDGVRLILPLSPYDTVNCKLFCLSDELLENTKCFTTIHSEAKELGYNCPRVVKKHFSIKQLCYAQNVATIDSLTSCSLEADTSGIISSADNGAHSTIEIEQWKVYIDNIGPLYVDEYGYHNVFTWSAGTHDCYAEVTIPKIKAKDDCSGVKYVKAKLPGQGWTNLELDDDGYWVHPKSARTYRVSCGVYEVTYEMSDNCHNVSSVTPTYVKVVDNQAPTVITDDNIRVSLGGKTAWIDAEKFDGGSIDNCQIRMTLVRRTDWKEGCGVNLCNSIVSEFETEADMDEYIARYGLTSVLRDGDELEDFYADQYEWLRDDGEWCDKIYYDHYYNLYDNTSHYGDCPSSQTGTYRRESSSIGNYILEGWEYDIKSYWATECATDHYGNPIEIEENQLAASIGGGWGQKVPFCCEDACEEVIVEVLVIDKECNYSKGWVTVTVEDKSAISTACEFDNITLSCNSYNKYYKEAIDAAIAAGNNSATAEEEFKAVDDLLGDLLKGWRGEDGETLVDKYGNELEKEFTYKTSKCKYDINSRNVKVVGHDGREDWITVYDTTVVFEEVEKEATKGGVYRLCGAYCKQDIWVNLNSCGVGTVTRRWSVKNGCGDHDPTPLYYEQVITVESTCELNKHMFDIPQDTTICVEKIGFDAQSNVIADAGVLEYLLNDLECRQLGYGYTDELFSIAGDANTYKLHRNWRINDWCNSEHLDCLQKIILKVGGDCGMDTSASRSRISGAIVPNYDDDGKVALVEVKALVNDVDEDMFKTDVTGTYQFDVPSGSSVVLTPAKNTQVINGITIGDIIEIHRHIIQSDVITDPYELIAADVNNDALINSKDILSIRRVSLRKATSFPNNTSWRFFESQTGEESYTISAAQDAMSIDFIGVKIGDVDKVDVDASRSSNNIRFVAEAAELAEGQSFSLSMSTSADLAGYQFAIKYDPELIDIESIEGVDMNSENWNRVSAGELLVSYNGANASSLIVNVVAKANVDLSEAITIGSANGFDAMAVLNNLDKKNVDLTFDADSDFNLFQNSPNPVHNFTSIKFNLPDAMDAKLSFYDLSGKVLKVIEKEFGKGLNNVNIGSDELGVTGVVYYQLETDQHSSTKRMVLIQ